MNLSRACATRPSIVLASIPLVLLASACDAGAPAAAGLLEDAFPGQAALASWEPTEVMLVPRSIATPVRLDSGQVLLAGGLKDEWTYVAQAERYEPSTNTWLSAGTLKQLMHGPTLTLLTSGKVLLAGGALYNGATKTYFASTQIYNPAGDLWGNGPPMATPRVLHAAVRLPTGKVLVTGGHNNAADYLASTEMYDPVANAWSPRAPLNVARTSARLTLLPSGKVLATGGEVAWMVGAKTVELYDPTFNTWTIVAPTLRQRHQHAAALLPDGRVLVAGINEGLEKETFEAGLDDAELYDPATNKWTPTSPMPARAWGVTLTVLKTGKVLLTHREHVPEARTLAQIYDPSTDLWTVTKAPEDYHYVPDATLLDNGKVLLTGAFLSELSPHSEVYDPGAPPGTPCSDGDTCESGFCVNGVCCDRACDKGPCEVCSVEAGAAESGVCSALTGSACDDGDPCSFKDTCGPSGACAGTPRVCKPIDECHEAGACDPDTGLCASPPKPDGAACGENGACSSGHCALNDQTSTGGPTGGLPPDPSAAGACSCSTPGDPRKISGNHGDLYLLAMALLAAASRVSRVSQRAPARRRGS